MSMHPISFVIVFFKKKEKYQLLCLPYLLNILTKPSGPREVLAPWECPNSKSPGRKSVVNLTESCYVWRLS